MTITTYSFIYAIAVCILFYVLRGRLRKVLLALASLLYVFLISSAAGAFVLAVGVLAWGAGLVVASFRSSGREKAASAAAYVAIAAAALSLAILKYFPVYF